MEKTKEKSDSSSSTGGRSELPNDVIESIFRRLPAIDLVRIKALSKLWNSLAESLPISHFRNTPFLILPPQADEEKNSFTNYSPKVEDQCRLVNLRENIAYPLKKNSWDDLYQVFCIGSSHGWLIFVDWFNVVPFLFNPFTQEKIKLPSFKSLIGISEIKPKDDPFRFLCLIEDEWREMHYNELFQCFVTKAILTADPSTAEYGVVLKCYIGGDKLLYYKKGDGSWRNFFTSDRKCFGHFQDMICYKNCIYVLEDWKNWIYIWDLENGYPEKMAITKTTLSTEALCEGLEISASPKRYLVELNGEILLVSRFIDTPSGVEGEIGPHKTVMFNIFKLDSEKEDWLRVKTLGPNVSVFVGRNHSMAVSVEDSESYRGNCVYFTHDSIDLFLCDWSGRDMGIYSLDGGEKLKKIEPILDYFPDDVFFWPIPCWIFPCK